MTCFSVLSYASVPTFVCSSQGAPFRQISLSLMESDSWEVKVTVNLHFVDQSVRTLNGSFSADVLQIKKNKNAKYATTIFGKTSKRGTGVYTDSGAIILRNDGGVISTQIAIDGSLYYARCE